MYYTDVEDCQIGGVTIPGVQAVAVSQKAEEVALEWGATGPHVIFADVVRTRVTVRVTHALAREGAGEGVPEPVLDAPALGDAVALRFVIRPGRASRATECTAACICTGIEHEGGAKGAVVRTLVLEAISSDGAEAPLTSTVLD
ncbi:hypothetical protein BH11PLA1_BH11PLA1_22050 [soil metagenome]